jgi:hypothetical protein
MSQHHHEAHPTGGGHYLRLAVMAALSFVAMYVLMYAMVDKFADVFANVNQFYMAGLMTAPMVVIELLVMASMYPNRSANAAVLAIAVLAGVGFWLAIRYQAGVGDVQFLRSMIPHHSGAILMCEQASISDAGIRDLCSGIVSGQQSEIDQMNAILDRLANEKGAGL